MAPVRYQCKTATLVTTPQRAVDGCPPPWSVPAVLLRGCRAHRGPRPPGCHSSPPRSLQGVSCPERNVQRESLTQGAFTAHVSAAGDTPLARDDPCSRRAGSFPVLVCVSEESDSRGVRAEQRTGRDGGSASGTLPDRKPGCVGSERRAVDARFKQDRSSAPCQGSALDGPPAEPQPCLSLPWGTVALVGVGLRPPFCDAFLH